MSKKQFSVRAIFSVLAKRVYGENNMDDVYEVLGHVAGKKLATLELSAAANKYRDFIYKQHPDEMKKELDSWNHTPDWREKIAKMRVQKATISSYKNSKFWNWIKLGE